MNLKAKISLQFTITVMTIITVISVFVYLFTINHRKEIYSNRQEDRAKNIASIYITNIENFNVINNILIGQSSGLIDESFVIIDYKNKKSYHYDFGSDSINTSDSVYNSLLVNLDQSESYIYRVNDRKNDILVQITSYDKYGFIRIGFLLDLLVTAWIISLIITAVTSWFFVKNVLDPVSKVVKEVNNINANNLNARVSEGNGKDEIAQLGKKFNEMLVRLEESFNIQKTFVSNASHELKTPLTSLTGQIEVALLNDRSLPEYKELLSSLLEDLINLNKLTQQLLDFAHINISNIKIPFDKIRIDEFILNVREDIIRRIPDFNVTVYFDNFSEEEELLTIEGNEHLLKIAFFNLLENAYKYSFDKSAMVYFRIIDNSVKITIKDFGIGISTEDLEKISEPFYRSNNVINIKGHGIGLSLTKRIIQIHQGIFDATSKVNHGSSFTITLPVKSFN